MNVIVNRVFLMPSCCLLAYRNIGILSMQWCIFSKLAARMGAYFHGVLINGCNFLVACSCVENKLVVIYLRPRCSNFCPVFIQLFYNQRYSQQSISCCQPLPTSIKCLKPRIHERLLLIPGYILSEALPLYSISIACLQLPATFKKGESANSLSFAQ